MIHRTSVPFHRVPVAMISLVATKGVSNTEKEAGTVVTGVGKRGMRKENGSIKASAFELSMPTGYDEMIQSQTYHMSPQEEGKMLFFPATMSHQVYPFYESLEDRISISGNIGIDTDIRNKSTGGKEDAKWDKNEKPLWHS